jgi:hypothetical protein
VTSESFPARREDTPACFSSNLYFLILKQGTTRFRAFEFPVPRFLTRRSRHLCNDSIDQRTLSETFTSHVHLSFDTSRQNRSLDGVPRCIFFEAVRCHTDTLMYSRQVGTLYPLPDHLYRNCLQNYCISSCTNNWNPHSLRLMSQFVGLGLNQKTTSFHTQSCRWAHRSGSMWEDSFRHGHQSSVASAGTTDLLRASAETRLGLGKIKPSPINIGSWATVGL